MTALADCEYCGCQPERISGGNSLWAWYQVRCRNVACVEHGTRKHLTQGKADRMWNHRQAQHKNILKNAAIAASNKIGN